MERTEESNMKTSVAFNEIVDLFFLTVRECIESVTLPTGENLLPTLWASLVIFLASLVCHLFDLISLIRWQGALIACVFLFILFLIERRGAYEVSRVYRIVKSRASAVTRRAAGASATVPVNRGTNPGDEIENPTDGHSSSGVAL